MGIIKNIIEYGYYTDPSARNTAIVESMLSDKHLQDVKDETWEEKQIAGITVPKKLRTDDFKDKVLKPAQDIQKWWKTYTSENPEVKRNTKKFGITTKSKKVTLQHKVMLEKFGDLGNNALDWLDTHPEAGEDDKKREHCQEFVEMAKRGMREVERNMLRENPDEKMKAEKIILKHGISGKDYAPELLRDKIPALAKDAQLPLEFMRAAWKGLSAEATEILPDGFEPLGWVKSGAFANPNLPEETRPLLLLDEAEAVNVYSAELFPLGVTRDVNGKKQNTGWLMTKKTQVVDGLEVETNQDTEAQPFALIQAHLKKGKPLPPELQPVLVSLRNAFQKCRDLDPPVDVIRDLEIADVPAFRQKYAQGNIVTENGFASAAAKQGEGAAGFSKNVRLEIKAKRGIDLSPYSNSTEEMELLLDHQSTLRVMTIVESPERLIFKCEQV